MPHHTERVDDSRRRMRRLTTFLVVAGVLTIASVFGWRAFKSWDKAAPTTMARSCESWGTRYAVIPWNAFPNDTLRVGRREEWLIRLSPTDTSGVVVLDPRSRNNWTLPTDTVRMFFSDGLTFIDAPGKQVERGRRNVFRALGEGCLLVRVSG